MPSSNYNTLLLASTIEHYIPTLEDQVFSSKPFLWALRNAGRIKNYTGRKIVQPLMYAEAPNHGAYADDDTFTTDANTGFGAAEYDIAQYYALVHFTGIELAKNSGKEAILSLMESRLQQAELTIAEQLDVLFLGSSSGWHGLQDVVDDANPSWGNFGGIDRSVYTYWQAYDDATAEALSLAKMRTAYNTASEGNDQPTNVFTTQSGFEAYEALLQDTVRHQSTEIGDAGFQHLMFKDAPITFDRNVADGEMDFVNLKYLTVGKLDNTWFETTDFIRPVNQDVLYKQILVYGQLFATNCARQARLSNLTDA